MDDESHVLKWEKNHSKKDLAKHCTNEAEMEYTVRKT